ncbi:coiled-coil-helix-coiled-coil-helix domain-containing protein 7 isoform X2 [Neovison vison]|uniref:coiled-coil-helix-coiled-coil-helix domain-containing protein 7 isoform X2 n=1 Tax=Neovison vison TaxID=452646 RepID=UPI001CF0152F|nr:coiled-coil-helix-coiled-coil-helix domain-containing protein 7 isoform X2 [Neogale vison]
MPMVARRLRDPDINPCLSLVFFFFFLRSHSTLLNDAFLTYLRNPMLLPDVWMKITTTGNGAPLTS